MTNIEVELAFRKLSSGHGKVPAAVKAKLDMLSLGKRKERTDTLEDFANNLKGEENPLEQLIGGLVEGNDFWGSSNSDPEIIRVEIDTKNNRIKFL